VEHAKQKEPQKKKWKEHLSQQQEGRCHRQCEQQQADQARIEKIGV
jgi:hypothetical protein